MKKNLYKNFGICQHFIDRSDVEYVPDIEPDFDDSPLKKVLDEIFSVDPRTGAPKGDIAYFLSKDGNPEVKAWLETNLLQPRRSVSSHPDGVTDEVIAEFSRNPGESGLDYAARLVSIRDEAIANVKTLKDAYEKRIKDNLQKPDVVTPNEPPKTLGDEK